MTIGYKILHRDGRSISTWYPSFQYPLPIDGQPGAWTDVIGCRCPVSITGKTLFSCQVPADWCCVVMECEEPQSRGRDADIVSYGRVRVLSVLDIPPSPDDIGDIELCHDATLVVSSRNVHCICLDNKSTLTLPLAVRTRDITLSDGAVAILPHVEETGDISISKNATLTLPVAHQIGDITVYKDATAELPNVIRINDIGLATDATLLLPKVIHIRHIHMNDGAILTAPQANRIRDITLYEAARLTLPRATEIRNVCLHHDAVLTVPKETKITHISMGDRAKIVTL